MNLTPSSVTPLPMTRPVSSLSQPAGSQYPGHHQHQYPPHQSSYSINQSAYNNNTSSQNFSMNSSTNLNYSINSSQNTANSYMGGGNMQPQQGGMPNNPYSPSSGSNGGPPPTGNGEAGGPGPGQEQPVSHSSPRYPPQQGYHQQPYWGYHQQSVE
jgi:hypothetical protein